MSSWNSIDEMFDELHKHSCNYLILRNYEEMDEDNFYCSGHADIDILTDDNKKMVAIMKASPRFEQDDGIHYIINVKETPVIIDLRTVGDNYYDKNWTKNMLRNRIMYNNRFYIMDKNNYYYSLIYHANLQKEKLGDDYLFRLNKMAQDLDISAADQKSHLDVLECFMQDNGYYYTYPLDIWVTLRTDLIKKDMIKKEMNVRYRDFKQYILGFLSNIKHKLFK